jgi:energy-coupling factor transporter ATP-binding protein EcfA2
MPQKSIGLSVPVAYSKSNVYLPSHNLDSDQYHSESYSTSRHHLGVYFCVCNTCRYTLSSNILPGNTASLKSTIYAALASVVLKEPFLRIGIIDEATKAPSFVYVPTIDLDAQVKWETIAADRAEQFDEGLTRILAKRHDTRWADLDVRPPWQVVVVPRPSFEGEKPTVEVVFAYHHSIGDGLSGKIFHTQLLEALNNPNNPVPGLSGNILELPELPTLPEPVENLVPFKTTLGFVLLTLYDVFAPKWMRGTLPPPPWCGADFNLKKPFKTNVRLLTITPSTVNRLLAACRAQDTTLTPLLNILVLISLARHVPPETATSFTGTTPISLRPYVRKDAKFDTKTQFSGLVTAEQHDFTQEIVADLRQRLGKVAQGPDSDLVETQIWTLSTKLKIDLRKKAEKLPADDMMGMLKYAGDWHPWWQKMDGKPRKKTWEVSNVGTMDGGCEGSDPGQAKKWTATRDVFSQSAMKLGAAIGVNVAGIAGGVVSISLTWPEGVVDNELINGLMSDLAEWTRRFGEQGKFGIFSMPS